MEYIITYRSKYKFQLYKDYQIETEIKLESPTGNDYVLLDQRGLLTIKRGYAWDGATGLYKTPKSLMRATLIHDSLYQLMREKLIDRKNKNITDTIFYEISVKDGLNPIIARIVYWVVKKCGEKFTDPANDRPILTAP